MSASDRAPASLAAEDRTFSSNDVTRIAGITLRQLQWLDERRIVSPRQEGRRRKYEPQQVMEILTVSALRRKGLPLQRIRRVLRVLRRDSRLASLPDASTRLYIVTDGENAHFETQPERIVDRLAGAKNAMYLVCLSDLSAALDGERPGRRARDRQLALF